MRNTPRVLAIVGILFLGLSTVVHADTYVIFDLGTDEDSGHIYGLDSAGDVYLSEFCGPEDGPHLCIGVFDPRQMAPDIQNKPSYYIPISTPIAYDSGISCDVNVIGAVDSVCNNGYFAYEFADNGSPDQVFGVNIGPNPPQFEDLPFGAAAHGAFIAVDSLGDVAWSNELNKEEDYEAYDLTSRQTPEPSTWILMATGFLGLGGIARRKFIGS
jgi:hypothetical protein